MNISYGYNWKLRGTAMLNKVLKIFVFVFFFLLLTGCARDVTPIEKVTTPAIKTVEEALDYAKGNITETDDTRFLEAHLEACHGALVSCETPGVQAVENEQLKTKNREMMIIIAAVVAFILGRALKV